MADFSRVALCLLFIFCACFAALGEIIPMDRRIIWTPGVPGGIPNVPAAAGVTDFGAVGDGVTDDAPAFQNAIDATSAGNAILIPEGTWLLKSPLSIAKGVVLRGEGPDKTRLVFQFDGNPAVSAIEIITYDRGPWVDLTGGYAKDSTVLSVADASSFTVGEFAEIQQDNDPAVMYTQPEWDQSWADNSIGQLFQVTALGSGTVTVQPPVHLSLDANFNPQARSQGFVTFAGIEHLHLRRNDTGDGNIIHIKNAAFCWLSNVESEFSYRCHVDLASVFRCEIRDSYFHDAHDHGGGGHGYGVGCGFHTTDCLIENNLFVHLRHSMIIQCGANGNVYGYNYSREPYQSEGGSWTPCDISMHGHYPFMNLFEGNTLAEADISDYWGPCGPGNTIFRCRLQAEGIEIMDYSHRQNIVGNELTTSPNLINVHADVQDTLIHGNYQNGSIQWDPAIPDHNLPASYYLSSKPAFFDDLPWPTSGGDLAPDGGLIPAEIRWRLMNCPDVSVSSVCLKGTVSDASGCPPEVNVGGTPVPVNVTGNNGTWQKDDVPLPSNPTQINVSTQDAAANTRSLTITVQTQ